MLLFLFAYVYGTKRNALVRPFQRYCSAHVVVGYGLATSHLEEGTRYDTNSENSADIAVFARTKKRERERKNMTNFLFLALHARKLPACVTTENTGVSQNEYGYT